MIASSRASSPAGAYLGTGVCRPGRRRYRSPAVDFRRRQAPVRESGLHVARWRAIFALESRTPVQFLQRSAVEAAGWAGVAQLVEHLICNQRVGGSNPFASSKVLSCSAGGCAARFRSQCGFLSREALSQRIYQEGRTRKVYRERRSTVRRSVLGVKTGREDFRGGLKRLSGSLKVCAGRALPCRHYKSFHAQVGERLKPTDCKSVGLKVYEGSNPSLCTIFCRTVGAWLAGCSV